MTTHFVVENTSRFRAESEPGWRNCLGQHFNSEAAAVQAHQSSPWKELPSRLVQVMGEQRVILRQLPVGGAQ